MEIETQILSAILTDNLGQRITHATAVGLVAVFRQELSRHRDKKESTEAASDPVGAEVP